MLNGAALEFTMSAAAFHGEMRKELVSIAVVLLAAFAAFAAQAWFDRKSPAAIDRFGITCLVMFGLGAAMLLTVGLL